MEDISKPIYFAVPYLDYLPRTEARNKVAKLNNLYDRIVEAKLKSMKIGEIDKKINDNSADLLEYMIYASSDPENPTLTSEELRVSYNFLKSFFFFGLKFY